jgi:nitrate/TMAO reductase-like tetraheme cytochrome c subunit
MKRTKLSLICAWCVLSTITLISPSALAQNRNAPFEWQMQNQRPVQKGISVIQVDNLDDKHGRTTSDLELAPANPKMTEESSKVETSGLNILLQGRENFTQGCTGCHDAAKSLSETKSYSSWMHTVEEMAAKKDADIAKSKFESIAAYLTLVAGKDGMHSTVGGSAGTQDGKAKDSKGDDDKKAGLDKAVIATGQAEFQSRCTSCHDAEKSTSKTKSLSEWKATNVRMAAKQGANIPNSSIIPIATYLASLSEKGGSAGTANSKSSDAATSASMTVNGTISPTWRGGNDNLQNGGFFPDAWLGANWDSGKQLSGRVTSCVSCHTTADGQGDRFELVEAVLRYDLTNFINPCQRNDAKAAIEAGRFIVPFGAFASQNNPGVYRTVTRPLIFNMGQRVSDGDLGDPVLPMPYADEGANLSFSRLVSTDVRLGLNGYVVNGLQSGTTGINFDQSRDYVASNNRPSWGSRATLSGERLNLGASILTGQSSPSGGFAGFSDPFYYKIYGYDATYRIPQVLRVQFEYARRESDRGTPDPDTLRVSDRVSGYYIEGEYWLQNFKRISLLARYDKQERRSLFAPEESTIGLGSLSVERTTFGLNLNLRKAGLLMIDYEHWTLPDTLGSTDVIGTRWAYTF